MFCILLFTNCKNSVNNYLSEEKTKNTDVKDNTFINASEPFTVNNTKCNWQLCYFKNNSDTIEILELKNYKTQKTLLIDTILCDESKPKFDVNYDFSIDFQDANFDGFDDYVSIFHYQNSRTNNFKIYAFNPKLKNYEFLIEGDDLEIDTINKTVSSSWFSQIDNSATIYHFKNGKIDFYEEKSQGYIQDSEGLQENIYRKIKNEKIVIEKIDTTKME